MIASWLVYTLILSAFVALVAAVTEPVLRSRGWRVRHLWAAALVTSALLPAALAVRPRPPGLAFEPAMTAVDEIAADSPQRAPFALDGPVGVLWAGASGVLLLLIAGGLLHLRSAVRRARRIEIDGTTVALTDRLGPGATPFGEPRILVPDWFSTLSPTAQRLLVLHEREHLQARDPEWLLAGWLVIALTPWNLAAWWMLSRLVRAIEMDCDARVLGRAEVRPYGELLIDVAGRVARTPLVGMLGFTRSDSELKQRIDQMTLPRRPLGPARQLTLGAIATLAVVAACEMPAPDPVGPTPEPKIESPALASKVIAEAPMVVVRTSAGVELYRDRRVPSLQSEAIESVEVRKGAEMGGGLVMVTLKEGATFEVAMAVKAPAARLRTAKERLHLERQAQGGTLRLADPGRVLLRKVEGAPHQLSPSERLDTKAKAEVKGRLGRLKARAADSTRGGTN